MEIWVPTSPNGQKNSSKEGNASLLVRKNENLYVHKNAKRGIPWNPSRERFLLLQNMPYLLDNLLLREFVQSDFWDGFYFNLVGNPLIDGWDLKSRIIHLQDVLQVNNLPLYI